MFSRTCTFWCRKEEAANTNNIEVTGRALEDVGGGEQHEQARAHW